MTEVDGCGAVERSVCGGCLWMASASAIVGAADIETSLARLADDWSRSTDDSSSLRMVTEA